MGFTLILKWQMMHRVLCAWKFSWSLFALITPEFRACLSTLLRSSSVHTLHLQFLWVSLKAIGVITVVLLTWCPPFACMSLVQTYTSSLLSLFWSPETTRTSNTNQLCQDPPWFVSRLEKLHTCCIAWQAMPHQASQHTVSSSRSLDLFSACRKQTSWTPSHKTYTECSMRIPSICVELSLAS